MNKTVALFAGMGATAAIALSFAGRAVGAAAEPSPSEPPIPVTIQDADVPDTRATPVDLVPLRSAIRVATAD